MIMTSKEKGLLILRNKRSIYSLIISCFVFVLIVSPVSAQNSSNGVVVKEVTGYGVTRGLALSNGLIEAIQQVKGVDISNVREVRSGLTEVTRTHNGRENDYSIFIAGQRSKILSKTRGYIKSYKIINDFVRTSDGWNVSLRVEIPFYKVPGGKSNKRKIAVIPFKTAKRYSNYFKEYTPYGEISSRLAQRLVIELTQSRRFDVMDREYMNSYLRERNMLLSPDASTSELSKLGQVLGVDYMLVGRITNAALIKKPYSIQITGESGVNYSASFTVDYRIIVMATRQIKWADTVSLSFDNSDLVDIDSELNRDKLGNSIITIATKDIVNSALGNIYPIRVIKSITSSNTIILNRGGVSLGVGELLDVFRLGERLKDPYTGESLGAIETWVASAKITRSQAKMSYAQIFKGDISQINKNSICRRIVKKKKYHKAAVVFKEDNVNINDGGGVKLPFD